MNLPFIQSLQLKCINFHPFFAFKSFFSQNFHLNTLNNAFTIDSILLFQFYNPQCQFNFNFMRKPNLFPIDSFHSRVNYNFMLFPIHEEVENFTSETNRRPTKAPAIERELIQLCNRHKPKLYNCLRTTLPFTD